MEINVKLTEIWRECHCSKIFLLVRLWLVYYVLSVITEREIFIPNLVHINMCVNPDVIMIMKSLQFSKFMKLWLLKTLRLNTYKEFWKKIETRSHFIAQSSLQLLGSQILWLWLPWYRDSQNALPHLALTLYLFIYKHIPFPIPFYFFIGHLLLSFFLF